MTAPTIASSDTADDHDEEGVLHGPIVARRDPGSFVELPAFADAVSGTLAEVLLTDQSI